MKVLNAMAIIMNIFGKDIRATYDPIRGLCFEGLTPSEAKLVALCLERLDDATVAALVQEKPVGPLGEKAAPLPTQTPASPTTKAWAAGMAGTLSEEKLTNRKKRSKKPPPRLDPAAPTPDKPSAESTPEGVRLRDDDLDQLKSFSSAAEVVQYLKNKGQRNAEILETAAVLYNCGAKAFSRCRGEDSVKRRVQSHLDSEGEPDAPPASVH